MAVCGFCRSTLVRHDADLENLGKMAELAEDRSPFKLRFRGAYRKVGFELIGRLQLAYEDGFWNEWYARFDDGRLGWLSEGSGLCYVTFEKTLKTALPPLASFTPGMTAKLDGESFTVSNIEHAHAVAVEGELPFKATPGYEAPAVDLRSETRFASLDYSETPPRVYLGAAATLDEVLDPAAPTDTVQVRKTQARAFKCTSCGAPLSARGPETLAVGCGHCGSVIDPNDANLAIISRVKGILDQPSLPMGSQGKLRGRSYTVIGYLKRVTVIDSLSYYWNEYLLHAPDAGYAWLVESQGHWNLAKPVSRQPTATWGARSSVEFLNRKYKHFQKCQAEVCQVLGEFTWRVAVGESVQVHDFISPPYLLSAEFSKKELSWTLSEYLPGTEVSEAFKPAKPLPAAVGVAANQPSPTSHGRYWLAFGAFCLLAVVLQLIFSSVAAQRKIWEGDLSIPANATEGSLDTPPIRIERTGNLEIRQSAPLQNRWLYTDLALINRSNGDTIRLGRELSYYSGVDSDGSWTEGSQGDDALLAEVPAGDYVLQVDAETEAKPEDLTAHIMLVRDVPIWSNFWLLLFGLSIVPLLAWWRSQRFEIRRWAESDYPLVSGGDDD
ncbi:DUF4178 domain-containing protein [Chitinimonas arctica]|nr:DUF4178 domain-containing protein [Chitinimonas arctica]